jgi:hypothetical protein
LNIKIKVFLILLKIKMVAKKTTPVVAKVAPKKSVEKKRRHKRV